MKLLLHMCCAPCGNRPLTVLQEMGHDVTVFWYNPNIHPYTEHRSRREWVEWLCKERGVPLAMRNEYGLRPFIRAVAEDIPGRCGKCYDMRFQATAQYAKENGFDGFASTLFISPYQNHDLMNQMGRKAAQDFGVEFLEMDFRPYFKEGQEFARENRVYMQKFCGCIFSEQERYQKAKKIIP